MPALEPRSEQSTAVHFSVAAFQAQVNRAKWSSVAALYIHSTLPILYHLDRTFAIFMCEFSANFPSTQLAKTAIEASIVLLSPPEIKCLPPIPGDQLAAITPVLLLLGKGTSDTSGELFPNRSGRRHPRFLRSQRSTPSHGQSSHRARLPLVIVCCFQITSYYLVHNPYLTFSNCYDILVVTAVVVAQTA